jgi:hypothetical protein
MPSIFPAVEFQTSRAKLSLDGAWSFSYDADDAGRKERWFAPDHKLPERTAVPGCAQTKRYKSARGNVRVTDDTIDMVISLIPFDTVNWLVRHIPIVGENLAGGSHGLIAAYFHVSGPLNNPSVVPKPITSVAAFVAKTLSLPINIIVPNTIKP